MKTHFLTSLLLVALAPLCALATPLELAADDVQIELRAEVVAGRRDLRLGDVAIVRTRDLTAIHQLVALPIGSAPRPGAETVVRREAIARWVRSQLRLASGRTFWTGPDETLIRGAALWTAVEPVRPVLSAVESKAPVAPSATSVSPVVARGDWVVLQLKSGTVALERRTQALEDGQVGETVKVRGENGPVEARITAPGRVEATL